MKKVLVCGGRDYDDWGVLYDTLYDLLEDGPIVIIQGGAKGADFLAKVWAKHMIQESHEYPANWKTYGKRAGSVRNQQMLDEGKPDLVVAFQGGHGTADMVRRARKAGVEVLIVGENS